MADWNPFGWLLLGSGFLFGMIVGGPQAGDKLWLISYTAMLAGLTILLTNLIRTLWQFVRSRKLTRSRLPRSAGLFSRFWREKGGASATEYALILGIVASGIAVAAGTLGSAISNAMDNASTCIAQGPDCSP